MIKYKTLDEFFGDQPADKLEQISVLRSAILDSDPGLVESIKWNAPNYSLSGTDRITFNLMNKQGKVKVVLHMGSTIKENKNATPVMQDHSGMIEWNSDIRGTITFNTLADVRAKQSEFATLVKDWLAIA